jgi:hypothetical protein
VKTSATSAHLVKMSQGLVVAGRRSAARSLLDQHLEADPFDCDALELRAALDRCDGDLGAALATYRRLLEVRSDHAGGRHALSVLTGTGIRPDVDPGHASVAPFVIVPDVLAADARRRLLDIAAAHRDDLVPAGTGADGAYRPELRVSFNLYDMDAQREVQQLVVPRVLGLLDRLTVALATPVHDVDPWECRYRAYYDGSFFGRHRDRFERRVLTWVYWFHHLPQRFLGGDLLLYDRAHHRQISPFLWTRIAPIDNALICFRSDVEHEVTLTHCDVLDPLSGRFIVHGHIRGEPDTGVYEPI